MKVTIIIALTLLGLMVVAAATWASGIDRIESNDNGGVLAAGGERAARACEPCDTNCDGGVDMNDVGPFVDLLVDSNALPCSACAGDANEDGVGDGLDLQRFTDRMMAGS